MPTSDEDGLREKLARIEALHSDSSDASEVAGLSGSEAAEEPSPGVGR